MDLFLRTIEDEKQVNELLYKNLVASAQRVMDEESFHRVIEEIEIEFMRTLCDPGTTNEEANVMRCAVNMIEKVRERMTLYSLKELDSD